MKRQDFTRKYLPTNESLANFEVIEPYFKELLGRSISTTKQLEQWLYDQSELASALAEIRSRRHVAVTCNTDDELIKKAYLEYIEQIAPRTKPYWFELNKRFLVLNSEYPLGSGFEIFTRSIQAQVRLFCAENIQIETDLEKLAQEFQEITGAQVVQFDGREQTLPMMARYLEEQDRTHREAAWRAIWHRRMMDKQALDKNFDQALNLRTKIAKNAGFNSFIEYIFLNYERFDYSSDDCHKFHQAVEQEVVPLARLLAEKRKKRLKLDQLRPWDMSVDPEGRAALRPFVNVEELAQGVHSILTKLDPWFAENFKEMQINTELDLESRKAKAPGGYLTSFDEARRPFIFMNAAGLHRDVETLLHESGHAFHYLLARHHTLLAYRNSPIEFAEVASMSMELFADDFMQAFYSKEDALRAKQNHLEGIINFFPWCATVDAFQHWIYNNPQHTVDDRERFWLELDKRFGVGIDYSTLEQQSRASWQKQLHIFLYPFYYIEYGIAQLGALQLWDNFKQQPKAAIECYKKALALGGSVKLPELFKIAGAKFAFDVDILKNLMQRVKLELEL